jgi:VWFA-related protein
VNVDTVLLNVSVRDRNSNRSIAGLQKDDFRVYENGVEQQIQELLPTEAPFNLLLLLDVSGSTSSYVHLMQEAATEFTRQINEQDRIAVASFNSRVQLLQDFTSDRTAAARAIGRIRSGGGTAFYDALMTCVERYMSRAEGRKAIVVFTDGVDNQLLGNFGEGSRTRFNELFRRIQESDTIIYTIFLDSEGQVPAMTRVPSRRYPRPGQSRMPFPLPLPFPVPGGSPLPGPYPSPAPSPIPRQGDERAAYETAREQLVSIAEQTGGRMYTPARAEDLAGTYSQIADDLRIQYLLAYASSDPTHDGRWRSINVEVPGNPDAVIRTRKGYYAAALSQRTTSP